MNSQLNRHDLFSIGLNHKNSLKVLNVEHGIDDVLAIGVVGDQTGCLQSFRVRSNFGADGDKLVMPAAGSNIRCVDLIDVPGKAPKILCTMTDLGLKCVNLRGKVLFSLELSHLTEPIKFLKFNYPQDIFVCSDFMFHRFTLGSPDSGQKYALSHKDNFVSSDKITSLELLEDRSTGHIIPLISSMDRLVRSIRGSSCDLEIETDGIPTILITVPHISEKPSSECLFCYGSAPSGKVSMVSFQGGKVKKEPVVKWIIPEKSDASKSAVECLAFSETGAEMCVGRSDGTIDCYSFASILGLDDKQLINYESAPVAKYTYNCGEGITSLVITPFMILVVTFPGSVFALTEKNFSEGDREFRRRESNSQIEALQQAVQSLEDRVEVERSRYFESTNSLRKNSMAISALPVFRSTDSLLLQEDSSYLLSLEMEVAIDVVIVQCDIPIDLLDTENNSAVVSFSKSNGQEVLATFRCQSKTTSLNITIRTVEGQYGVLRVYVLVKMNPKSCHLKTYQIKPLSLHKRCHRPPPKTEDTNYLTIEGDFSPLEAHSWMRLCLPEVPEKVLMPDEDKLLEYHFSSALLGSSLSCGLKRGQMKFESNNVSTVSILKDFIARECIKAGLKIEATLEVSSSSLAGTLRALFPIVRMLVRQKQTMKLRDAILQEIIPSDPVIGRDMLDDLENDVIDEAAPRTSISYDRTVGLIVDLVIDYHKVKGRSSKAALNEIRSKIPDLEDLIDSTVNNGVSVECEEFVQRMIEFWNIK